MAPKQAQSLLPTDTRRLEKTFRASSSLLKKHTNILPPRPKPKQAENFLLVPIITVRSRVSLSDPTHISSLLNWKFHILNAIFHVIKRLNRTKSVTYASLIPIGHGKSARTQRISTSISLGGALMNSSRNDFL